MYICKQTFIKSGARVENSSKARCYYCKISCVVQCGHCFAALMYLGQKHNCPDPDEGFFDDNDFDIQVCSICDSEFARFS